MKKRSFFDMGDGDINWATLQQMQGVLGMNWMVAGRAQE